jgi:hypothetical protein
LSDEKPATQTFPEPSTARRIPAITFTAEELAAYVKNAERWMADDKGKAELRGELATQLLVKLQVLSKLGNEPMSSRSGPNIAIRATQQYTRLAKDILEVIGAAKKPPAEADEDA